MLLFYAESFSTAVSKGWLRVAHGVDNRQARA